MSFYFKNFGPCFVGVSKRFLVLVAVWPHSRNLIALVSGRLGFVFFSTSVVAVVVHRVFVLNTLTLFIHLCPNRLRLSQSFFPPALFLPHFTVVILLPARTMDSKTTVPVKFRLDPVHW